MGEVVSLEELGGGKMYSSVSGVMDYLVVDDVYVVVLVRRCVSNFNWFKKIVLVKMYEELVYDLEELLGIVSINFRKLLLIYEVIVWIVDGSKFGEFKRDFGIMLVMGFVEIYGYKVGIVVNNGILFSSLLLKGVYFIELCF